MKMTQVGLIFQIMLLIKLKSNIYIHCDVDLTLSALLMIENYCRNQIDLHFLLFGLQWREINADGNNLVCLSVASSQSSDWLSYGTYAKSEDLVEQQNRKVENGFASEILSKVPYSAGIALYYENRSLTPYCSTPPSPFWIPWTLQNSHEPSF